MIDPLPASDIARTIGLVVAPAFLLTGIGAIMGVMAGRLNRVVDRSRVLEQLHPASTGAEHDRHVWELRIIDRRISLASASIFFCVASAVTMCLVVIGLFVAELVGRGYGDWVALLFVASMTLLAIGLILFLVEIRVAVRAIHVRDELLEQETRRRLGF